VQKYTLCVFRRHSAKTFVAECRLENTRYKTTFGEEEALPSVFRDMYFTKCFMAFASVPGTWRLFRFPVVIFE
jgi:hypothetical protein